jgi:hypothetical protein
VILLFLAIFILEPGIQIHREIGLVVEVGRRM